MTPSHYVLALNGRILPGNYTIKKAGVSLRDELVMISGLHVIHPRDATFDHLHSQSVEFRRSFRDSITSEDSVFSSMMNQSCLQEIEDLRQELEDLRKEVQAGGGDDSRSMTSHGSVDGGESSGGSKSDVALLRKKIEAYERSAHESMSKWNDRITDLQTSFVQLRRKVDNLSQASLASGGAGGGSAGQSFSSLQLNDLEKQVNSMQQLLGTPTSSQDISVTKQIAMISARMQTIQRDIGNLKTDTEDIYDRLDALPTQPVDQLPDEDTASLMTSLMYLKEEVAENKTLATGMINDCEKRLAQQLSAVETRVAAQKPSGSGGEPASEARLAELDTRVKSLEMETAMANDVASRLGALEQSVQSGLSELEDVKGKAERLETSVEGVKQTVEGVKQSQEEASRERGRSEEGAMEQVKRDLQALQSDVMALKEDWSAVEQVQNDLQAVQQAVGAIEDVKRDVESLQQSAGAVDDMKRDMRSVQRAVDSIDDVKRDVQTLQLTLGGMEGTAQTMEAMRKGP